MLGGWSVAEWPQKAQEAQKQKPDLVPFAPYEAILSGLIRVYLSVQTVVQTSTPAAGSHAHHAAHARYFPGQPWDCALPLCAVASEKVSVAKYLTLGPAATPGAIAMSGRA